MDKETELSVAYTFELTFVWLIALYGFCACSCLIVLVVNLAVGIPTGYFPIPNDYFTSFTMMLFLPAIEACLLTLHYHRIEKPNRRRHE